MPARCVNTLVHEVLNSTSLPMWCVIDGGITSQPSRQPVIKKLLEKLCTTTRSDLRLGNVQKLGRKPLAVGS
jgi:hypothetical protein